MSRKNFNRRNIAIAFCLMGLGVKLDHLIAQHALFPLPWGGLLSGAATGFLLPGGIVAILVRDITGFNLPFVFWVYLSMIFWFFPIDRIRRWFGTFDAFTQHRHPLLARGLAHALDFVNRRLFGRQKTGGFA